MKAYKISTIVDLQASLPTNILGVKAYKISTIVDTPPSPSSVTQGVKAYKISTIVDLRMEQDSEPSGVKAYKISTIVDAWLDRLEFRDSLNSGWQLPDLCATGVADVLLWGVRSYIAPLYLLLFFPLFLLFSLFFPVLLVFFMPLFQFSGC